MREQIGPKRSGREGVARGGERMKQKRLCTIFISYIFDKKLRMPG